MKPCQTPARGRSVFVLLACALSWLCTVAALAAGEGQDAALAVPAARHLLAKRASSDGASSARTRRNRARASQTNAAVRQWSDWRSRLFANVMTAYKRLELERKALVEPAGHRAFDLFSPFMDCPGGRPPVLIGGIGDGAKFACMEQLLEPDCVVYSLVSRLAWEEAWSSLGSATAGNPSRPNTLTFFRGPTATLHLKTTSWPAPIAGW